MLIDIPRPRAPRTEREKTRAIRRLEEIKGSLFFLAEREPQLHEWLASLHPEDRKKIAKSAVEVFGRFRLPEEPKDDSDEEAAKYVLGTMEYAYGNLLKKMSPTPYRDLAKAFGRQTSKALVRAFSNIPGFYKALMKRPTFRDFILSRMLNPFETLLNPAGGILYRHYAYSEFRDFAQYPHIIQYFDKDMWKGRQAFSEWLDEHFDPDAFSKHVAEFRKKQLEQVEAHLEFIQNCKVSRP